MELINFRCVNLELGDYFILVQRDEPYQLCEIIMLENYGLIGYINPLGGDETVKVVNKNNNLFTILYFGNSDLAKDKAIRLYNSIKDEVYDPLKWNHPFDELLRMAMPLINEVKSKDVILLLRDEKRNHLLTHQTKVENLDNIKVDDLYIKDDDDLSYRVCGVYEIQSKVKSETNYEIYTTDVYGLKEGDYFFLVREGELMKRCKLIKPITNGMAIYIDANLDLNLKLLPDMIQSFKLFDTNNKICNYGGGLEARDYLFSNVNREYLAKLNDRKYVELLNSDLRINYLKTISDQLLTLCLGKSVILDLSNCGYRSAHGRKIVLAKVEELRDCDDSFIILLKDVQFGNSYIMTTSSTDDIQIIGSY